MSVVDPAGLDPAMVAAQAAEAEQKKSGTDLGGAGDVIEGVADLALSGAGQLVGEAVGAAVELTGAVASGALEIAGSILGGLLEL